MYLYTRKSIYKYKVISMKNNLNIKAQSKESEALEQFKIGLKYSTSYWDFLDSIGLSKGKSDGK